MFHISNSGFWCLRVMPYWPIVHAQHFFLSLFRLWIAISLTLGDVHGCWKHFTLLFKEGFVLKAWDYFFTWGGKENKKASLCPWVHMVGTLSCGNKKPLEETFQYKGFKLRTGTWGRKLNPNLLSCISQDQDLCASSIRPQQTRPEDLNINAIQISL